MTREEEISLASKLQKKFTFGDYAVARKAAEATLVYSNGEDIETIHSSYK